MPNTTNFSLPYPQASDSVDVPRDIEALAAAIDALLVPSGVVSPFAGSAAPTGWLLCDGSAVSRSTYSALFSVVGTTYGTGNGSTTFNLPNLKGRVPVGLDGTQTEFDNLNESGGAKAVTLTTAEMPSHNHTQDAHNHTQNAHNHTQDAHGHTQDAHSHGLNVTYVNQGASSLALVHGHTNTNDYASAGTNGQSTGTQTGSVASATATNQSTTATNQAATATNQAATATNQATGGGGAHNNLQPYLVLNYIIKA